MADISTPHKRRWWLLPLVLAAFATLLVADIYLLKPAIEQLSWKLASRNFDGWDIAATSENNIVLVGSHILHYNGLFWYQGRSFFGHAVGQNPEIPEYAQERNIDWPTMQWFDTYPNGIYTDVYAYDSRHIYAVGTAGILHYNGLWWSSMPTAWRLDPHPYQIWAQSPRSIYALDRQLGVLYWNGWRWNTLSLPIQGELEFYAVGGTEEHAVITGAYETAADRGRFLLIQEGDKWINVDTLPLAAGIPPDPDKSGPLQLDHIWGLDDGRILASLSEPISFSISQFSSCRRLLCYEQGEWSAIEVPDSSLYTLEYWEPRDILADEQGNLLVCTAFDDRMRQTRDESGALVWQAVDETDDINSGLYTWIDAQNLLVYGGKPVRQTGCLDCWPIVKPPCSLERYELAW